MRLRPGLIVGAACQAAALSGAPPSGFSFANSEASAFVARMTTTPDDTRKGAIDALFTAIKAGANSGTNLLTKLDALWLLAAADSQAASLNLISTSFTLTEVNSPSFTADRGYTGNGTSSYLDTAFNPATASSPHYTQTAAHFGYWSRTSAQSSAKGDMGISTSTCANARTTSDTAQWALNRAINYSVANSDGSGHMVYSRGEPTAGSIFGYRNGSNLGSGGLAASTTLPNNNFAIGAQSAVSPTVFSTRQFAAAHIGDALTDNEVLDLYNALAAYMTAVGA
jgi:hypothetical protein